MLVLSSCITSPKEVQKNNNRVYIPDFPDPIQNGISVVEFEINENKEVITAKIPYWYWVEIVDFAAEISELKVLFE